MDLEKARLAIAPCDGRAARFPSLGLLVDLVPGLRRVQVRHTAASTIRSRAASRASSLRCALTTVGMCLSLPRVCEHFRWEILEAPPGFEPGMEVLQTSALPLGDGA
jgi:hypothetical protein